MDAKEVLNSIAELSRWFRKEVNKLWGTESFDQNHYEGLKDAYIIYISNVLAQYGNPKTDLYTKKR
jgi:hypothetical protein